jgi:hypothetical protein
VTWESTPITGTKGTRKGDVAASGKPKSRNREVERLRSQEARAEDMLAEVAPQSPRHRQIERSLLALKKKRKGLEKAAAKVAE